MPWDAPGVAPCESSSGASRAWFQNFAAKRDASRGFGSVGDLRHQLEHESAAFLRPHQAALASRFVSVNGVGGFGLMVCRLRKRDVERSSRLWTVVQETAICTGLEFDPARWSDAV